MRIQTSSVACILAAAVFALMPIAVSADEEKSYEQLSPNGKYVFVMLSKTPDTGGKVDTLKARYRHSGLYRANNHRKSLWRVNWYSSRVHISSDGAHLARIGRTSVSPVGDKPNMAQLALAFYNNGNLIKKYTIEDLIRDPRSLFKSKDGFEWQNRIAFDDSSKSLEVALVTGQTKVFDIKSGSMTGPKNAKHKRR